MSSGSYQFEALGNTEFQTQRLLQQAHAVRGLEANLLRNAGIEPGHDVLEVGSGPGYVTDLLAELAADGCVHALEPSAALLSQIESNVTHKPAKGLFVHQGYGNAIPLPNQHVDFTYSRFVLQHVPQPDAVVADVFRVTRQGGRFCVVDSDDGLVIFHPEDSRVSRLLADAQATQARQGGDRFVGRKLQSMLLKAGFRNVRTRVLTLTSTELPFEVLFNILLGYKASLLGDAVDARALYEALEADVATGQRLVVAGVFIVTGERN